MIESDLKEQLRDVREEARMILPGSQTLLGFQLIAAYSSRFTELERSDRIVHLVAFLLVAIAIALLMAPAAFHRQVMPGFVSNELVRSATRCITWALAPMSLAIGLDGYLLCQIIVGRPPLSWAFGIVLWAILVGAWFAHPRLALRRRERAKEQRESYF
jgi:hypothetical protein